jgi:uncharacterized cupredoxin-like copper-binding protein
MRSKFGFETLVMVAAVGVAVAGCGSSAASPSAPAAGSISVTLSEWAVTPATLSASAGEITFAVSNTGDQIHEFVVVKTDLKGDALPVVDNKIDESSLTPVDEIEDIAAGSSPTLKVTLAAGHYVLLCNIETHYGLGMHADFDVN